MYDPTKNKKLQKFEKEAVRQKFELNLKNCNEHVTYHLVT